MGMHDLALKRFNAWEIRLVRVRMLSRTYHNCIKHCRCDLAGMKVTDFDIPLTCTGKFFRLFYRQHLNEKNIL